MGARPWLITELQQAWNRSTSSQQGRSRSRRQSRCSRRRCRRPRIPLANPAERKRRGDSRADADPKVQLVHCRCSVEAGSGCVTAAIGQLRPPGNCSEIGSALSGVAAALILRPLALHPACYLSKRMDQMVRIGLDSANTLNSNAVSRRFIAHMLSAHNEYRAIHQAPPLRHSEELTHQAQAWAETMAAKDALAYDPKCERLGIGENVARKCDVSNVEATTQEFVDTWYSEVHNFDWRSLDDQFECSHFAQVVWRSSREAGFGRAVSVSGCVYIVGRYRPTGNNPGDFPRNVLPCMTKNCASSIARDRASSRKLTMTMIADRKGEASLDMAAAGADSAKLVNRRQQQATSQEDTPRAPARHASMPPPPPPPLPLFPKSQTNAAADKYASGPAPAPMSVASLFGALAAKSAPSGPAQESPSMKSLFGALSTKTDKGGATGNPMTTNILHQTLGGSHLRDGRSADEDLEEIPAFNIRHFINQMLVSHNDYRVHHKAPPLRLNHHLNRMAQDWADVLAKKDKMAHDPNCAIVNTGENVAMKFRIGEINFTGDVFTDMWYEEIDAYDWNSSEPQPECGHFTQLVWKSTSEVGFGRAVSDTGRVYVVGRYRPPGNFKGGFKRNVLPSVEDLAKASGEDASFVKEPMQMPSPMAFAMRYFDTPKRRSVKFGAGEPPPGVPSLATGGGPAVRGLPDFLPLRSALRTDAGKVAPTGGSSPMAALLLRQTQQQSQQRVQEKEAKEKNLFSIKKFENQLLVSHNEFRALHRSPPLRLNPELSKLAQSWAEVLAVKDKMAHDPKCCSLGLGENVAMKFRKGFFNFPGDLFSELWYHEIDQYKWTGEDQLACGHFTQLVWRSSTEVGFGRAVAKSGRVYVVGRYRPPGNFSGQFGRNVLPPSRVMPKSRSNFANRSNLSAGKKAPSKVAPVAPATPAGPVEFAGFGTARVVERRQGSNLTSQRPLSVYTASSALPSTASPTIQQQQSRQQNEKQSLPNPSKSVS